MRVLGAALAGVLALTAPIVAHAEPLVGKRATAPAGPPSAIVQIWDGSGSGGHPVASDHGGYWPFGPRVDAFNRGWCPPRWGQNRFYSGSGFYRGPGVPTYWVWGPSGGAFDYPDLLGQ